MVEKKSKANNERKEVQQIQEALGFSHHDSEALLAHAAEVQTSDIIPLQELKRNADVDSTRTTLNSLYEKNPSANLDRNGPR